MDFTKSIKQALDFSFWRVNIWQHFMKLTKPNIKIEEDHWGYAIVDNDTGFCLCATNSLKNPNELKTFISHNDNNMENFNLKLFYGVYVFNKQMK